MKYRRTKLSPSFRITLYNKISNYITKAVIYFGASAPSSGSFDIAVTKFIKY